MNSTSSHRALPQSHKYRGVVISNGTQSVLDALLVTSFRMLLRLEGSRHRCVLHAGTHRLPDQKPIRRFKVRNHLFGNLYR